MGTSQVPFHLTSFLVPCFNLGSPSSSYGSWVGVRENLVVAQSWDPLPRKSLHGPCLDGDGWALPFVSGSSLSFRSRGLGWCSKWNSFLLEELVLVRIACTRFAVHFVVFCLVSRFVLLFLPPFCMFSCIYQEPSLVFVVFVVEEKNWIFLWFLDELDGEGEGRGC